MPGLRDKNDHNRPKRISNKHRPRGRWVTWVIHDVPEQLVGFYIGDFGDQLWPHEAHA